MQQFITDYGYLAIFVLMLAESACIPVPSELIMTFGGRAEPAPGAHRQTRNGAGLSGR